MIVTTCLQNVSPTYWMGEQDLRDCDYVSAECEPYLLDGEQDLRYCDYVSTECESYLLDGEAGFE